jgi:hypothetical protein
MNLPRYGWSGGRASSARARAVALRPRERRGPARVQLVLRDGHGRTSALRLERLRHRAARGRPHGDHVEATREARAARDGRRATPRPHAQPPLLLAVSISSGRRTGCRASPSTSTKPSRGRAGRSGRARCRRPAFSPRTFSPQPVPPRPPRSAASPSLLGRLRGEPRRPGGARPARREPSLVAERLN